MENTKTVNVVSTPNIEGNIGSCSVSINEVTSANRFFTTDYHVVQVNACTDKIINQYDYTSYFGAWTTIIIGVVMLYIIVMVNLDSSW